MNCGSSFRGTEVQSCTFQYFHRKKSEVGYVVCNGTQPTRLKAAPVNICKAPEDYRGYLMNS